MANLYLCTYDFATLPLIADVRFAIQDFDVDGLSGEVPDGGTSRDKWSCFFTDQEIQRKIDLHGGAVNQTDLAAADLLEDMASSAAILARLITLGDYTSDTRTTANALRSQAAGLRNRYFAAQSIGSDAPAEAFANEVYDDFSWRRYAYGDPSRFG